MIDWTKPIQTQGGLPARVLATDMKGSNPVAVAVEIEGKESVWLRPMDGSHNMPGYDYATIINVPEKRVGYLNIYENGDTDSLVSLDIANKASDYGLTPIARIKVEYTVGQFDT